MNAAPTVSVLVPVRGAAVFLAQAIDSLRAQAFTDWEALVCGVEGAALPAFDDPRVRVVGVAPGGVPYPVDIAAIAGARVATTADELAAYLDEFAVNPTVLQRDARAWLERERQFVDGPGVALRQFVADVIERGAAGIRTHDQLPVCLFTAGPHPVFQV